jgi:hypothetical protein
MDAIDDPKQEAQDFIRRLAEGDFAGARRLFDGDLLPAFPEARLKETWLQLIGQVGPFQKILTSQAFERQENCIVAVSCQFVEGHVSEEVIQDIARWIRNSNVHDTL